MIITKYTHKKINKIALNYFDDKKIHCNGKITTYPHRYSDKKKNINMQIRDNTVILNANYDSGIIPKNYNTKDLLKKIITSVPIDINKIIDKNSDNYTDSAKSTCIDIIKRTINYTDSAKSTCIDIIKSNNINSKYIHNIKSTTGDHIKSTNGNNKYIDNIIHKCVDKKNNVIAHRQNINNKSEYEISALLKSKKVTNISKNIIISTKTNHKVAIIKCELNMLSKL